MARATVRPEQPETHPPAAASSPPPAGLQFVSEPIRPDAGTFDAAAMARGEPGLPTGFTWRGQHYRIAAVAETWKESQPCDHGSGERYYRKRWFRVVVESGETMSLYALRHVKPGANAKARWWLFSIDAAPPLPGQDRNQIERAQDHSLQQR